jgi:putative nucleotidyltransferase with HDIG domain
MADHRVDENNGPINSLQRTLMFGQNSQTAKHYPSHWERQMRIPSTALRLGHFVSNMDRHWTESPFILQGVKIRSRSQLQWFQEQCNWVVIDLEKSQIKPGTKLPKPLKLSEHRKPIDRRSMKTALKSYVGLERQVKDVIRDLRAGTFISTSQMRHTINEIADQLFEDAPALIWLTHIKSKDNYTAEHCLNVAILAMGLAHSLGWKQDQIREAGLAGLLHDVGKTQVPSHILNKSGPLTDEEFEQMQKHTSKGFDMISMDPDLPMSVKKAALHHHERPDGQGYPYRLTGHQIPDVAALISIVDAYDAITSNRCYQKARNHHLALGILWKGRGTQFHPEMVEAFIQWIGWVSPGTLVKLTTGDLAIVVLANEGNRLQPTVRMLSHQENITRLGPVVKLAALERPSGESVYIDSVLNAGEVDIDIRELARQVLFDKG